MSNYYFLAREKSTGKIVHISAIDNQRDYIYVAPDGTEYTKVEFERYFERCDAQKPESALYQSESGEEISKE